MARSQAELDARRRSRVGAGHARRARRRDGSPGEHGIRRSPTSRRRIQCIFVAQSVDSLIDLAVRNRPELAHSARAGGCGVVADQGRAIGVFAGAVASPRSGGNSASNVSGFAGNSYSVTLRRSDARVHRILESATTWPRPTSSIRPRSRAPKSPRQQVIQQVFTSYYTLRTSTDRVRTSRDLLASATQSESVARERYRKASAPSSTCLSRRSALASARAQDVDARWQWRTSLAQLAHDVGVLNARGDTTLCAAHPASEREASMMMRTIGILASRRVRHVVVAAACSKPPAQAGAAGARAGRVGRARSRRR